MTTELEREYLFTWDDFNFLRNLSNEHTGIIVSDDKFDMFYSRLSRRVRHLKLKDFKTYCDFLRGTPEQEFTEFINAITTNLTSFFREKHHFEYLKNTVLAQVIKRNSTTQTITAWSAGCSTGEEAYSLAMTLLAHVPKGWCIKILATDLDTNVLKTASAGIYLNDRVTGLSETKLKRWFKKGKGNNFNKVKISEECRELVRFKQLNLIKTWPIKYEFDFIFCRNVFIYFDLQTKQMLTQRFEQKLVGGGFLFIGHSESIHQFDSGFEAVGTTIYKKKE